MWSNWRKVKIQIQLVLKTSCLGNVHKTLILDHTPNIPVKRPKATEAVAGYAGSGSEQLGPPGGQTTSDTE